MSRKISNEEIRKLKEKRVGQSVSHRDRLLDTLSLLLDFADEEEGLTPKEIARVLSLCSNKGVAERSVRADLIALSRANPLGIRISKPTKGSNKGYCVASRMVSPDEAVLLADMVKTCKFITEKQRSLLEEKLRFLMSEAKEDEVIETIVSDIQKNNNAADVLAALNTASRAIQQNLQVCFCYKNHWMNGEYHESERIIEDPVMLFFSFGNYYLQTLTPQAKEEKPMLPQFRRLDHICQMSIPGTSIVNTKAVERIRRTSASTMSELVDMRGDGISRTLFLRVEGRYAGYVYDRFGHDLRFEHINEDAGIGYACVRVQLSETLFRWVFGMNGGIAFVKPKSQKWIEAFSRIASDKESFHTYLEDYSVARRTYSFMVDEAIRSNISAHEEEI